MTELIWDGKYTEDPKTGKRLKTAPVRVALPFQTIETVNESAGDRDRTASLFAIEYTDNAANLRYYEPDFIAVSSDGLHYLLETKGREDIDVKHKDRAAILWCESVTALTDTPWTYLKIAQTEFDTLRPDTLLELIILAPQTLEL